MSTYTKWEVCPECEREVFCIVEGEISFPWPMYVIGPGPGPDVVRADRGKCEHGHVLPQVTIDRILDDIAAGDVL